jgi:hypothetical protein
MAHRRRRGIPDGQQAVDPQRASSSARRTTGAVSPPRIPCRHRGSTGIQPDQLRRKDINAMIPVKNPAYDSTAKPPEPGKKPHKDRAAIDTKTSGGKDGRQHIEKASDATELIQNRN